MPLAIRLAIAASIGAIMVGQAAAEPMPLRQPATARGVQALHDSGIPPIEKQSTAAPTVPTPILPARRRGQADGPLPVYRPVYPYAMASGAASGQPTLPAVSTLAEAVTLAYKVSPRLLSQRASLRAVDEHVPQARAAYGPSLDIQATYGFTHDWNDSLFNVQSNDSGWASSAAAILSQPILTFGRNRAGESVARAEVTYSRDQLRLVENQVLFAVVSDYVSVIRDATAVSIARQDVAILEKEHQDDVVRFKVREITLTDLQQVESRLATAQGSLLQAEGQLAASQAQFQRDVGAPAGELAPPDELVVPAQALDAAIAIADAESPVIHAAQSREKISRSEVQLAEAQWLPRIDLKGTAAVGTLTPYSDALRTRRLQAEVVATIPVLDSGRRSAKVIESREINQADWQLIDQALRETRASVAAAWDEMVAARASLEFQVRAIDSARQAFENGRIEERAGARTTLELLDLARDLLFVQTNYNTAIANEYLARANLLAAMGRLETQRLVPGSDAYDAAAHYRKAMRGGDVLLFTPLMRTLDGVLYRPVNRDRPIRDPGALTQPAAPMPPPAASTALTIDPTEARSGMKPGY